MKETLNLVLNKLLYYLIVPFFTIFSLCYLILKNVYIHSILLVVISVFLIFLVAVITFLNFERGLIALLLSAFLINSIPFMIFKDFDIENFYPISIFAFLGFVLGSCFRRPFKTKPLITCDDYRINTLWIFAILFIGTITISLFFVIWNNLNFFPLNATDLYIYNINVNNDSSMLAIIKSIYMYLNYLSLFIFLAILVKNIKITESFLLKFLKILIVSNIIIFFLSLYQIFIDDGLGNLTHWEKANRINSTMTDPNALGFFLIISVGVFTAFFFVGKKWKITCLLMIPILIFQLLYTGSRTGLLGLIFFLFILITYLIISNFVNAYKSKNIRRILILTFVTIILLLILNSLVFFILEIDRFNNLPTLLARIRTNIQQIRGENFLTEVLSYRNIIWSQAINMIKDYPLTGIGIGNFQLELSNYYKLFGVNGKIVDWTLNTYIQVLSENGIFTFIFFLGFFIVFLIIVFESQTSIIKPKKKLFIAILFLTIVVSLIMFNTIPGTNFFEIQIYFSFIIGLLLVLATWKRKSENEEKDIYLKNNGKLKIENGELKKLFTIFISVFFAFSLGLHIHIYVNYLNLEKKAQRFGLENFYGFYLWEKEGDMVFCWTRDCAMKIEKKKGNTMYVPIGCSRPDIKQSNINLIININEKIERNYTIDTNEWRLIAINLGSIHDEYVKVRFKVDNVFIPADLIENSKDYRRLGVKIGTIFWE